MRKLIGPFLGAKRQNKRIITICYDIVAISLSFYLAIVARWGSTNFPFGYAEIGCTIVTVAVTLMVFVRCGMYRAVLRYMMLPAMGYVFLSVCLSAVCLTISRYLFESSFPRSVPFIYAGLAILSLGGPRVLFRTFYYHYYKRQKPNVFIYGAGATGRDLMYALVQGDEYHPVCLLDDDEKKVGQIIGAIRVHHSKDFEKLVPLYQPVKLLLAINNISKGERLRLLEKLAHWPIEVQSVPSVEDIAAGKAHVTDIRDLNVAELLGRLPVEPDQRLLEKNIRGKSVMVTGAGGSIGAELCRQILAQQPETLLLFELNEFNLYSIDRELTGIQQHQHLQTNIIPVLGSVQSQSRLQHLMRTYRIETLYHTAAYKHVPLVEDNVIEGINNNVFGTLACARAAILSGVRNFTLISTDKAVRPTNVMGASKRMAELVLQALADEQDTTLFTMVRFGNVLSSSGSVVPLFKEQVRKGGPVTVTHPDVIRYFMLIPEAAQLVIQAGSMGKNGQVFVLDMGEPVKILDLAKRIINLMGLKEHIQDHDDGGDIEIKFTGLRAGEKLYEELLIGETEEPTSHPKIMSAREHKLSWVDVEQIVAALREACDKDDAIKVREILLHAPTGYQSPDLQHHIAG